MLIDKKSTKYRSNNVDTGNENASTLDTLRLASKLGSTVAGELGARAFEQLELALTTKLFPKKFTDIPTLRSRQHILLYWRRGFLKTTLLRVFSELIPNEFRIVNLTSATTEILCGSILIPKIPFQQPRVIPPVLANADVAFVSEHLAFLKHGGPVAAKLAILNDILEGDRISKTMVKLGQVQIDPTQKPELEKLGVRYEPSEPSLSYEPDVLFFSASHPFDRKTLLLLTETGHLDRFHLVQVKITHEIASECFKGEYSLDTVLYEQLKRQNKMLGKVRIESIEAPPHDLLKPMYERLFALTEIPDFRIKGEVLRTAACMHEFQPIDLQDVLLQHHRLFSQCCGSSSFSFPRSFLSEILTYPSFLSKTPFEVSNFISF